MSQLPEDQKKLIWPEPSQHLTALHEIRSHKIGGPFGVVIPPYRVMDCTDNDSWPQKLAKSPEYVFCHDECMGNFSVVTVPFLMYIFFDSVHRVVSICVNCSFIQYTLRRPHHGWRITGPKSILPQC